MCEDDNIDVGGIAEQEMGYSRTNPDFKIANLGR